MPKLPAFFFLAVALHLASTAEVAADERDEIRMFMQGRYVFQRQCAVCHGKTGRGDGELSAGVKIKPRDFRKGVFKFRTTPLGKLPTDADLKRTILSGVSGSMMPAFTTLSESDMKSVIIYIKAFSPRWRDPDLKAEPVELPVTPDWFSDNEKREKHAKSGGEVFKLHCASCHGERGKGDGPGSKGLVDVWGNPVVPEDLASPHHRSGPASSDLLRTIATGLDGTPMVGFLDALGGEKLWQLVAFIETLGEEAAK